PAAASCPGTPQRNTLAKSAAWPAPDRDGQNPGCAETLPPAGFSTDQLCDWSDVDRRRGQPLAQARDQSHRAPGLAFPAWPEAMLHPRSKQPNRTTLSPIYKKNGTNPVCARGSYLLPPRRAALRVASAQYDSGREHEFTPVSGRS